MLHEAAYYNLIQLHIQPSEIRDMTWPEYLGVVLGFQEQEDDDDGASGEPLTATQARARIAKARDSVTSVSPNK